MSRYIDADEFEKYLNREEWETPDEKWWSEREIGMIIDAIPIADVVDNALMVISIQIISMDIAESVEI